MSIQEEKKKNGKIIYLLGIALVCLLALSIFNYYNYLMASQQLNEAKNQLYNVQKQLNEAQDKINQQQLTIQNLEKELNDYKRYKLKNPTLDELQNFLAMDDVNTHEYIEYVYDCQSFSRDLRVNAKSKGYNLSYITVDFYAKLYIFGYEITLERAHALNGAYLADGRWVWIEPQTDKIFFGSGPYDEYGLKQALSEDLSLYVTEIKAIIVVW